MKLAAGFYASFSARNKYGFLLGGESDAAPDPERPLQLHHFSAPKISLLISNVVSLARLPNVGESPASRVGPVLVKPVLTGASLGGLSI